MSSGQKKACAIMQPTYLPWSGYFAMMCAVDIFVYLDDVQLTRRGEHAWHQRNRILLNGDEHWLVVPVKHQSREQLLSQSVVDDSFPWRRKHLETLRQAYGSKSYIHEVIDILKPIYERNEHLLGSINREIIEGFANALGIDTPRFVSSTLGVEGTKGERLEKICRSLEATHYVAAPGSRGYLEQGESFRDSDIRLSYFNFVPAAYPQRGAEKFVSHLSIVDVIAHLSLEKARLYIVQAVENS